MSKKYDITNQKALRKAFWEDHPNLSKEKVKYGLQRVYNTDARCAFVDWLDMMHRDGRISDALAQRATLGGD